MVSPSHQWTSNITEWTKYWPIKHSRTKLHMAWKRLTTKAAKQKKTMTCSEHPGLHLQLGHLHTGMSPCFGNLEGQPTKKTRPKGVGWSWRERTLKKKHNLSKKKHVSITLQQNVGQKTKVTAQSKHVKFVCDTWCVMLFVWMRLPWRKHSTNLRGVTFHEAKNGKCLKSEGRCGKRGKEMRHVGGEDGPKMRPGTLIWVRCRCVEGWRPLQG